MSADAPTSRERLVRAWSKRGPLRTLLGPLAWGYRFGVASRRAGFRVGVLRRRSASVPVVSVGNLTVGGTGKTPATLWLAGRLHADGRATAIVTRGYGGSLGTRTEVVGRGGRALLDVDEIGDEAALLALRFPGPVVSGADRARAVELAVEREGAEVVVLDDGFQHWRLARDADLVLVDGRFGFGNGALLPAGPLREPVRALKRAHAIVVTKAAPSEALAATLRRRAPEVPVFTADLSPVGVSSGRTGSYAPVPSAISSAGVSSPSRASPSRTRSTSRWARSRSRRSRSWSIRTTTVSRRPTGTASTRRRTAPIWSSVRRRTSSSCAASPSHAGAWSPSGSTSPSPPPRRSGSTRSCAGGCASRKSVLTDALARWDEWRSW